MPEPPYPPIRTAMRGLSFLDYHRGGYRNTYHSEETGITQVKWGKSRKGPFGVTFYLGDDAFYNYADLERAFYESHPEMVAVMRAKSEAAPAP